LLNAASDAAFFVANLHDPVRICSRRGVSPIGREMLEPILLWG
jgi:hypothetical protein